MPGKKKSRYYPVQSRINLSTGGMCIVPNVLSMINRRHYPATGVYETSVTINPQTSGLVQVYALKDNWDTIGAIRQAYKAYLLATEHERAQMSKEQVARWEDFRIAHGTGLTEMTPMVYNQGTGLSALTVGEFELSKATDSAGNTKIFTLQGASSTTQYNILTEWSESGNVDADPATLSTGAPYQDLDSNLNSTQANNLQRDGNVPPYDIAGDDGLTSPWTRVATLNNDTVAGNDGRLSTGFFRAPLGMILITGVEGNGIATVQVREGSTKGIKVHNILG